MFDPENPPELEIAHWFNTSGPRTLSELKGKVVVMAAFQLDCPTSMTHGLPQAARLSLSFRDDEIAVIALATSFGAKTKPDPEEIKAFAAENKLPFAVAVDVESEEDRSQTAAAYDLQGTPALLLFDRQGRLRRHYFGHVDDLRIGAEVMTLAIEDAGAPREQSIALEQRLAAALIDPDEHHHHEGGCCGGHDHYDHAADGSCCSSHSEKADAS